MQNAAFHALGLRAVYVALRCAPEDVAPLMRALARAGGGGNVTIPHKEGAAAALAHRQGDAETVGACNVFWGDGDGVRGDNTDVEGLLAALDPLEPPAGPWLIIGAGGGARAAAVAAGSPRCEGRGVVPLARPRARLREMARGAPDRHGDAGGGPRRDQRDAARAPRRRPAADRSALRARRRVRRSTWCIGAAKRRGCAPCERPAAGRPTGGGCWWRRERRRFDAGSRTWRRRPR